MLRKKIYFLKNLYFKELCHLKPDEKVLIFSGSIIKK